MPDPKNILDLEQFTILEAKILETMAAVTTLRQENRKLQERVLELEAELVQAHDESGKLRDKLGKEVAPNDAASYYKEREAHIRRKVEALLSRLEAVASA